MCLSKSSWIELNDICSKLGIHLIKLENNYAIKTGEQVIVCHKKAYQFIIKKLIESELLNWKQLESQGRLADLEKTDYACSMEHLKNGDLSDDLTKFITKVRLQIAESNSLLHVM